MALYAVGVLLGQASEAHARPMSSSPAFMRPRAQAHACLPPGVMIVNEPSEIVSKLPVKRVPL